MQVQEPAHVLGDVLLSLAVKLYGGRQVAITDLNPVSLRLVHPVDRMGSGCQLSKQTFTSHHTPTTPTRLPNELTMNVVISPKPRYSPAHQPR